MDTKMNSNVNIFELPSKISKDICCAECGKGYKTKGRKTPRINRTNFNYPEVPTLFLIHFRHSFKKRCGGRCAKLIS